jgi:hypothetical protein
MADAEVAAAVEVPLLPFTLHTVKPAAKFPALWLVHAILVVIGYGASAVACYVMYNTTGGTAALLAWAPLYLLQLLLTRRTEVYTAIAADTAGGQDYAEAYNASVRSNVMAVKRQLACGTFRIAQTLACAAVRDKGSDDLLLEQRLVPLCIVEPVAELWFADAAAAQAYTSATARFEAAHYTCPVPRGEYEAPGPSDHEVYESLEVPSTLRKIVPTRSTTTMRDWYRCAMVLGVGLPFHVVVAANTPHLAPRIRKVVTFAPTAAVDSMELPPFDREKPHAFVAVRKQRRNVSLLVVGVVVTLVFAFLVADAQRHGPSFFTPSVWRSSRSMCSPAAQSSSRHRSRTASSSAGTTLRAVLTWLCSSPSSALRPHVPPSFNTLACGTLAGSGLGRG